jgi:hypothetical protein
LPIENQRGENEDILRPLFGTHGFEQRAEDFHRGYYINETPAENSTGVLQHKKSRL